MNQFELPTMLNPPFPGQSKQQSRGTRCDDSSSSSGGQKGVASRGIWTTSDPNENDVLCGRSNRLNYRSGNIQFRQIIDNNRGSYNSKTTKKADKANIATLIVQQIRSMNPSGRFLKEDPKSGLWFDIGDVKATKKVSQELRKYNPNEQPPRNEISYRSVPEGTATSKDNNNNNRNDNMEIDQNGLNPEDFPVGRPYPFHPKIKLLNSMVENLLAEYTEADKITKRTLGNGQELRSRHEIINLLVETLTSGEGQFKKKQKDGSWVVDKNYSESKLRTRIINTFSVEKATKRPSAAGATFQLKAAASQHEAASGITTGKDALQQHQLQQTSESNNIITDTCENMDGVEPMEVEFGRFFKPVEETMSVSDVSGLSSIQTMSTISVSGLRSAISGMRSNVSGLKSNISGFSSNAESSNMGGRSRTSLTLASVFSTGKTHDTYSRRKRNKKRFS
mmetsp:Transcript_3328/g.5055  ORF Transcript_3328/g.5055 Transcript_3328/m.5055 type:complete len:450 (-) Transcript_3328:106-1455(-)